MSKTPSEVFVLRTTDEPLYQNIIKDYLETSSIRTTADNLHISEVRVRKVLITEGLWASQTSMLIGHYLEEHLTTAQIAEKLHTTVKAVQQYLPYSRGIYSGDHLSDSAIYSAAYRERIRIAKEKVLKRKEDMSVREGWNKEENTMVSENNIIPEYPNNSEETIQKMEHHKSPFEQYPGIVCFRELPDDMLDWDAVRCRGVDVFRLHLELMRDAPMPFDYLDDGHSDGICHGCADKNTGMSAAEEEYAEQTRVLHSYGRVQFSDTISRDILIPGDMPLYALHYVIQRLFGWQNSHLHRFMLPAKCLLDVTDDEADKWANLVGVLFRSPWMEEEDAFWADDYEYGSFKTWLKKKYTGPYLSLCHGEGIIQCKQDIQEIRRRFPLVKIFYAEYEGEIQIQNVLPAEKGETPGEKPITAAERKNSWWGELKKIEVRKFDDCPVEAIERLFLENGPVSLLERLPVEQVLAPHGRTLTDALAFPDELLSTYEQFMDELLTDEIRQILDYGRDLPYLQPTIGTPADVLYYNYDFGDDWMIRITASMDACDLVEQGRVTQQELDEALCSVYRYYRPVCIAADGLPLVDDAGGISGYIRFLRAINPTQEKAYWGSEGVPDNWAYNNKKDSLTWAKSLGWTDRMSLKRML